MIENFDLDCLNDLKILGYMCEHHSDEMSYVSQFDRSIWTVLCE